jgi:hypothetical protein
VAERFTLLSELGRGGMGVVWKARDEETGSIVALKLLRETYAEDPDYVTRFERELELAKRIHSRNVIQVLGYGVRDKTPYLALEFVDGPSLRERLAVHGPYNWPEARTLLAQIAQGLADAHAAGVVHRDLKPSNVLIGSDGVAKLADFGIARGLDLTRVTGTSTLLGTPAYLAPEGPADERSDLYSLGVIAYELLTGVVPFEGRTYQEVILRHVREAPNLEKLPKEARKTVGWLLAKNPAKRPQSAAELVAALEGKRKVPVAQATELAAATDRPAPAQPMSPTPALALQASPDLQGGSALPPPNQPLAAAAQAAPVWLSGSRPIAARRRTPPSLVVGFGVGALVVCLVAAALAGAYLTGASRSTVSPLIAANETTPAATITPAATPTASPTPTPTPTPTPAPTPTPLPHDEFQSVAAMTQQRAYQTATLLKDGTVLLAGSWDGKSASASAEIYDPTTRTFRATGSMLSKRMNHTATLLPNGRVLIVGGTTDGNNALSTAELYDPATGKFSSTGSMKFPRQEHTATLLSDGKVLIAGGHDNRYSYPIAELYNPKTGRFTQTGTMAVGRCLGASTLLLDGRVLLTGNGCGQDRTTAELYNPKTGRFAKTGSLLTGRFGQTATRLEDGRVLIAGGNSGSNALASAELYDPKAGTFSPTGSMTAARWGHSATLVGDGRVVIIGGWGGGSSPSTADLYDPVTQTFSPAGAPLAAREDHTATLLADGTVLIAGGNDGSLVLAEAELYWP